MGNFIVFMILAAIAVASALGMLLSRNAIHSALFLVLNFCTIAVFYIVLSAPFIAMVQITVYAGAIVVLFLFVIMLLGAERLEGATGGFGGWQRPSAALLGLALLLAFILAMLENGRGATATTDLPPLDAGPAAIGRALFQNYVFPFELTSILLLVAMMSLVVWHQQRKRSR